MNRLAAIYPTLLLVGGVALIQYHAIAFWSDAVDPVTGWAWSILLELVALWLWYERHTRPLAFIATLLVLSGPLYQVSAPLVKAIAENATESASEPQRVALLREAIAQDEASLQTFLENSQARSGWLPAIEAARASLDEKREQLRELLTRSAETLPWQQVAVIVLQAVALVLIQISNVLAITALSRLWMETANTTAWKRTRKTPPENRPKTDNRSAGTRKRGQTEEATEEPPVTHIQSALRSLLEANGLSARAFAKQNGFSPRDLSLVLHDQENRKAGKRRAPRKVFDQLSALLLEDAA